STTRFRHFLPVDRIGLNRVVDAGHHVLAVLRSPGAPRPPEKFLAVPCRAAEIHFEHEVPVGREILVLEIEAIVVRGMRASMVARDEGIRPSVRAVSIRVQQEPLDGRAVGAREVQPIRLAQRDFVGEAVLDVRELYLSPSVHPRGEDLRRRLERADLVRHTCLRAVEAESTQAALAGRDLLDLSIWYRDAEEVGRAADAAGE